MELDDLFQAQRQLSEKDLIIYNAELQKKSKSVGLAYFLLICFGWLGLHKFYLGKIGEGIAYLIVGTIYYIFIQIFIFNVGRYWEPTAFVIIFFGTCGIFLIYDLFTLYKKVIDYERLLRIELLFKFGIDVENKIINDINNKNIKYYFFKFINSSNDKIVISYNFFYKIFIMTFSLFFAMKDDAWLFNSKIENQTLDSIVTWSLFAIVIYLSYELLDYYREHKKNIFILSLVLLFIFLSTNSYFFQILGKILSLIIFTWSFFEFIDFLMFKWFYFKHPPKSNLVRATLIFLLMCFVNYLNIIIWFLALLFILQLYYFLDKFDLNKRFNDF